MAQDNPEEQKPPEKKPGLMDAAKTLGKTEMAGGASSAAGQAGEGGPTPPGGGQAGDVMGAMKRSMATGKVDPKLVLMALEKTFPGYTQGIEAAFQAGGVKPEEVAQAILDRDLTKIIALSAKAAVKGTAKIWIASVLLVIAVAGIVFGIVVFVTMAAICNTPGLGTGASVAGTVSGNAVLQGIGETCKAFNTSVGGFASTANSRGLIPSGSVAQYAPILQQIAQAKGVDYCALEALMRKESSGNVYAYSTVFYPGSSVGPSGSINPNNPPPNYGLNFDGEGHGIGLLQVFIYNRARGWKDQTTPSRNGGEFGFPGRFLTITDLIDPTINIQAGTALYIAKLQEKGGNPGEAYRAYQGPSSAQSTIDKFMQYYNECLARPAAT